MKNTEYIIEIIKNGNYAKVSAIDTKTGQEANIIADARLNIEILKKNAIKKLEYLLNKANTQND